MILAGYTQKQIALVFSSTRKAIEHRVHHIAEKLQVNGRDLIVSYAICHQLISIEEARGLIKKAPPEPDPY